MISCRATQCFSCAVVHTGICIPLVPIDIVQMYGTKLMYVATGAAL